MLPPHSKSRKKSTRRQGIFWLLTIPFHEFVPYLPPVCQWITGQLESGGTTGYLHWQVVVAFAQKVSIHGVRSCFGPVHAELTIGSLANDYVHKDDTAVAGTRFELGIKPLIRNSKTDWERVWTLAQRGLYSEIPAHVRIVNYRSLKQITLDHSTPQPMERFCKVFWGPTATGKSRTAWDQAGLQAYVKNPRTKFWDGYQGEKNVIIDEFRGAIDISHLLCWTDRYPLRLETKGSGCVANFTNLWITSNLHPREWYPQLDQSTVDALMRRLTITHFDKLE